MVLLSENLTGRMAAWSCIELVIPGTDFWVELQGQTLVNKVTCKSRNPGYTLNSVNWLSQNFSPSVDFGSTGESWSHGELCHCWSVSPGYKQNSVTWMEAELWSLGKLSGPLVYETQSYTSLCLTYHSEWPLGIKNEITSDCDSRQNPELVCLQIFL